MEVDVAGRIIYFYGSDMVFQWEFHHDSHAEYRPIEGFDSKMVHSLYGFPF